MEKVRLGIIGAGIQGKVYLETLKNARNGIVTAVCDTDRSKIETHRQDGLVGENISVYYDYRKLIDSGNCDCVAVVTPHPFHLEISEYAFSKGLHVMCDKPISITVSEADRMLRAWKQTKGLKFSTMYTMRTTPANIVIKEQIKSGILGKIQRVDMVCTEWLRTQKYYNDQPWRGTWKGEGAGLLLNQAPHNLDLLYWWFGPAKEISAKVSTRYHKIETEDDVMSAIYTEAGFPIRFYANTGELPGRDYIEIAGDSGTLVREKGKVTFYKLSQSVSSIINESQVHSQKAAVEEISLEIPQKPRGHLVIYENLFDAIINKLDNSSLIAPGTDGLHSVEWANAMLYSSLSGRAVKLPLDRDRYDSLLNDLSTGKTTL